MSFKIIKNPRKNDNEVLHSVSSREKILLFKIQVSSFPFYVIWAS